MCDLVSFAFRKHKGDQSAEIPYLKNKRSNAKISKYIWNKASRLQWKQKGNSQIYNNKKQNLKTTKNLRQKNHSNVYEKFIGFCFSDSLKENGVLARLILIGSIFQVEEALWQFPSYN